MDVVVNVLASNNGHDGAGALALDADHLILVLGSFLGEARLDAVGVIVLKGAVLDRDEVVVVLLRQSLLVKHGLDRGVVVVLVDLLVHGRRQVLVMSLSDRFVRDGGGDLLVDGRVMVPSAGPVRRSAQIVERKARPVGCALGHG